MGVFVGMVDGDCEFICKDMNKPDEYNIKCQAVEGGMDCNSHNHLECGVYYSAKHPKKDEIDGRFY